MHDYECVASEVPPGTIDYKLEQNVAYGAPTGTTDYNVQKNVAYGVPSVTTFGAVNT